MIVLGTHGKYLLSDMAERIATLTDELGLVKIHDTGDQIVLTMGDDEAPQGSKFLFELQGNEPAEYIETMLASA